MAQLFSVTVEWASKGKDQNLHIVVVHVVAEDAEAAAEAAVAGERRGFEKELVFCRFSHVAPVAHVDLVVGND